MSLYPKVKALDPNKKAFGLDNLHDFHAAYVDFSKSVGLPYFTFEEVQATIAADAATNAFKY